MLLITVLMGNSPNPFICPPDNLQLGLGRAQGKGGPQTCSQEAPSLSSSQMALVSEPRPGSMDLPEPPSFGSLSCPTVGGLSGTITLLWDRG